MLRLFCRTAATLSRPAPVSTYFAVKGRKLAAFGAVELDKNEVPQLDESCAAGVYGAFVAGDIFFVAAVGAEVDVYFAARAAGAGFAHFPEVVFSAEFEDAVGGQRRYLCPEVRGFAVFGQIVVRRRRQIRSRII